MATSIDSTPMRATAVLDAARDLAPKIAARAAQIEAARRVPLDLIEDLTAAGCFRMLLPRSHGGGGVDLVGAMRVCEELGRADASVGWTVMIGASGWIDLGGLPRASFDALYADGPDVIMAGAFNPTGTAEAVPGGYRVSGRWTLVSGCTYADHLYGSCRVARPGNGARSEVMVAYVPASAVGGRSPAAVSTATGCTATASRVVAAPLSCAPCCSRPPRSRSRTPGPCRACAAPEATTSLPTTCSSRPNTRV